MRISKVGWSALVAVPLLSMSVQCQTKCPTAQVDTALPSPTITAVDASKSTVSGKVPAGADGKIPTGAVLICVDGIEEDTRAQLTGDGSFQAVTLSLKAGQQVTAKYLPAESGSGNQAYSLASPSWLVGSCSKDISPNASLNPPTLSLTLDPRTNTATYSGTVPGASAGSVRICVNDLPQYNQTVSIGSDGSFKSIASFKVANGQTIAAQAETTSPVMYGPLSDSRSISSGPLQVSGSTTKSSNGSSTVILIGGVEQAGYSSLSQSTNAFINVFISGPTDNRHVTGWGRVRLLSAPQSSTQGIVSVFADPTGQLTTQDYTKVGQALDFVGGPQIKIPRAKRWSLIGDFGVTTPLNSQTVALTYVAPAAGTVECSTLVKRFSAKNGYSPGLAAAPSGASTCLAGGYTDVAFSNQDRSSFFIKYGGGFRTVNTLDDNCSDVTTCTPSVGVLDLTAGQDEAVTRGLLRHVILKLDGMIPIKTGSASFVYLYGSAFMRVAKNHDNSPLILQTATGVTVPSSSVIVLPLLQPDRDFYRLGIGLNINQVFCKMFNSTCPSKPTGSAPAATTATTANR